MANSKFPWPSLNENALIILLHTYIFVYSGVSPRNRGTPLSLDMVIGMYELLETLQYAQIGVCKAHHFVCEDMAKVVAVRSKQQ